MTKFIAAGATAVALLLGTTALAMADGKITIATVGEPSTLDVQLSPVILVNTITQHIFETLFAFDGKWQSKPLLAAALPTVSEDGLTYVIPLREDVKFHNGATMTADDVVASLERWTKVNSRGKQLAPMIESLTATGPAEVTIVMKQKYAPLVATLSQYAVIMPASTLADTLTEFVGTGPYKLQERKPDQYIQLVKFDGYVSPEGAADNYAGHREAVADELLFMPVPDANTRVEGVLAGQYDYADSLPISAYDRLAASDVAEPVVLPDSGWMSLNMNMKEGILSDVRLRKAVELALNANDLMAAAFDKPEFFTVNGAMFPKSYAWYTEAGVARHGEGDIAAAQALMKEAGYKDQPIRILTTRQYEFHFKLAQVAEAYLEAAGFKVELMVSDWATLTSRRADPTQWDIFITHSVQAADPALHNTFSASYPGWYVSEGKDAALAAYMASSEADRMGAWEALQTQFYEDAPLYKVGDFNGLSGASRKLEGLEPGVWPYFWNVAAAN